jgi:hypothetical protein
MRLHQPTRTGMAPRRSCPTGYGRGLPDCKDYEWDDTPPLAGLPLRYLKYLESKQASSYSSTSGIRNHSQTHSSQARELVYHVANKALT